MFHRFNKRSIMKAFYGDTQRKKKKNVGGVI